VQCVRKQVAKVITALQTIVSGWFRFCGVLFRSCAALAAENLFLRKQLALFQEREKKAKATTAADRFVLSKLSRFFDWRNALVIVKPATLIGWHRAAFRRFWRWPYVANAWTMSSRSMHRICEALFVSGLVIIIPAVPTNP
jgi:hypothetical protein